MIHTQKGFGLLAAVIVVAAVTAGSYAAVRINEEIHSDNGHNGKSEVHATTTVSSHATSSKFIGHEGYLNASDKNNGLMIGASSTIQLGR